MPVKIVYVSAQDFIDASAWSWKAFKIEQCLPQDGGTDTEVKHAAEMLAGWYYNRTGLVRGPFTSEEEAIDASQRG